MCINCGSDGIGRRDLMKFGAAAAIALAAGGAVACGARGGRRADALSPEEALARAQIGQ